MMHNHQEQLTQELFDRKLIDKSQFDAVQDYRKLKIFSLHNELKLLLYGSVLAISSGIGILIYQNIDSIGHTILLALILMTTIGCFYFCNKNAKGFHKQEVSFDNPILDYLLLAAQLLTCVFFGYLQYQYKVFGTYNNLATLVPTAIGFYCAYYFDNKSILSLSITGLAAAVGLTVSPQALLNNETIATDFLCYTSIILGFTILFWSQYSKRIGLKIHFTFLYLTFALHLIALACLSQLVETYWPIFAIVLGYTCYLFYKFSYQEKAVSLFVFTCLYGYIGCNILLGRLLSLINLGELVSLFFMIIPGYFIGSIVLFIKVIKDFNKKIAHDSTR
jgi:hypothetical protein